MHNIKAMIVISSHTSIDPERSEKGSKRNRAGATPLVIGG